MSFPCQTTAFVQPHPKYEPSLANSFFSDPIFDPHKKKEKEGVEFEKQKRSEMRNKASGFLKQIVGVLAGLTKAKSLALKGKTNALKARVLLLSLLRNRRLLVDSISHKLHNLLGPRGRDDDDGGGDGDEEQAERSKAIVLYARGSVGLLAGGEEGEEEEEKKKYPELTHSLLELQDFEDPGGSVIDLVKSSKQEGEDFVLEDEIDRVADLFIRRFHQQIRMQKQLSLKRFNEALDRSPQ